MKRQDTNHQKVVPIRHEVTRCSNGDIDEPVHQGPSPKVEVVKVGKLKFTVYTNTPSPEAMDNFNECFQGLFEKTIGDNESDALPA